MGFHHSTIGIGHIIMRNVKIMAVSSGGGHWKQLCQLKEFFVDKNVSFVCTETVESPIVGKVVHMITDSNKDQKLKMLLMFFKAFFLFLKINPNIIITTGAAPGLSMVFWGWFFRRKTVWIDSIANVNELSLSGRLAKKICSITLSQWEQVAINNNVLHLGRLI